MKTLVIKWQRLVTGDGETCSRCGATEAELEKALLSLKRALAPLGLEVSLEKEALPPPVFAQDASQSNRIWIGGRSLEDWLQAGVGQSLCCGPCGDAECRTLELEGQIWEAIPAALIVKAGLLAAASLMSQACC